MGCILLISVCAVASGNPAQLYVLEDDAGLPEGDALIYRGIEFGLALGSSPGNSAVIDFDAGEPSDYAAVAVDWLPPWLSPDDYGRTVYEREGVLFVRFEPGEPRPCSEAVRMLSRLPDRVMLPEYPPTVAADPFVEEMVASVSQDSICAITGRLELFENRFWSNDSFPAARDWAMAELEAMGYEVEVQEFYVDSPGVSQNLIITIPGTVYPDRYWLVGAHLDSGSYPFGLFPGADDNASGSATVMEAARVMRLCEFQYTVKMALWGAEEAGLVGSSWFAGQAAAAGDSIMGYVNLDMILFGPTTGPISYDVLRVYYNSQSEPIAGLFDQTTDMYVPELERLYTYATSGGSDHVSFWQNGFTSVDLCESMLSGNPYYHNSQDLLANYMEYFPFGTNVTRSAVAFMAAVALPSGSGGVADGECVGFSVSLTPCPAVSTVSVSAGGDAAGATVALYDVTGRRMGISTLGTDGNAVLDVGTLPPGVYVARVEGSGTRGSARLVVCR